MMKGEDDYEMMFPFFMNRELEARHISNVW